MLRVPTPGYILMGGIGECSQLIKLILSWQTEPRVKRKLLTNDSMRIYTVYTYFFSFFSYWCKILPVISPNLSKPTAALWVPCAKAAKSFFYCKGKRTHYLLLLIFCDQWLLLSQFLSLQRKWKHSFFFLAKCKLLNFCLLYNFFRKKTLITSKC